MADDVVAAPAPAATPAPASPPAPSPAPSQAAPAPSSPAPSPGPAPAAPAAAPTPYDSAAALQQTAKDLGFDSPDDLRATLRWTREAQARIQREEQARQQQDPETQRAARRGQTFRELVAEGYSPEHAEYMARLPELFQASDAQRATGSTQILKDQLSDLGLDFTGKEGEERYQDYEDDVADILNGNVKLNALYHRDPTGQREAIRLIVERKERLTNHALLAQNAATLRDHKARRQSVPTASRGPATGVTVREEKPEADYSNAPLRRRQHREIASRQLGDLYTTYGGR